MLEIVIDGLTSEVIADVMRAGVRAIVELGSATGAARVSAGELRRETGTVVIITSEAPSPDGGDHARPEARGKMKLLVLRLRAAPEQRLDMSPLTPQPLAGKEPARDRRRRKGGGGGVFFFFFFFPPPRKRRAHRDRGRIGKVRSRRRRHGRGIDHGRRRCAGRSERVAGMTGGRLTVNGNAGFIDRFRHGGGVHGDRRATSGIGWVESLAYEVHGPSGGMVVVVARRQRWRRPVAPRQHP